MGQAGGAARLYAEASMVRCACRQWLQEIVMPVMKISFPLDPPPEYCARDLVVAFPALVDGEYVQCAITAEALEDHFGAASLKEDDLLAAFDLHRGKIEHAARRMLDEIGGKPVLLHSGFFRFLYE
ncbi:hypothetical protein A33K_16568 [Burkholderia humptydooensis MSMB43]|nr:hypothetical protein A33K_16568 [Burkholderia humptydooensis MSMB43]